MRSTGSEGVKKPEIKTCRLAWYLTPISGNPASNTSACFLERSTDDSDSEFYPNSGLLGSIDKSYVSDCGGRINFTSWKACPSFLGVNC